MSLLYKILKENMPGREIYFHIFPLLSHCVCSVMSDSLQPYGLKPTRLLCPWSFSWQEYRGGLPFPTPGDLPNPGTEPTSAVFAALAGGPFTTEPPRKSPDLFVHSYNSNPDNTIICYC